jgi:hypothetical protein
MSQSAPHYQTKGPQTNGPELWVVISTSSNPDEGSVTTVRAASVNGSSLIRIETRQRNPDSSFAMAGAMTRVPECVYDAPRNLKWMVMTETRDESESWTSTTSALSVANGCLLRVATRLKNPDGSFVLSEQMDYVMGSRVREYNESFGARFAQ